MSNFALESTLTREYTRRTGRKAYELIQDWQGRQLWYPTMRYATWLEGRDIKKPGGKT